MKSEYSFILNDPSLTSFVKKRVGWINKLRLVDIPDFLEEAWINDKHEALAEQLKKIFPQYEKIISETIRGLKKEH